MVMGGLISILPLVNLVELNVISLIATLIGCNFPSMYTFLELGKGAVETVCSFIVNKIYPPCVAVMINIVSLDCS